MNKSDPLEETTKTFNISDLIINLRQNSTIQKTDSQNQESVYLISNKSQLEKYVISKSFTLQLSNYIINISDSIQILYEKPDKSVQNESL